MFRNGLILVILALFVSTAGAELCFTDVSNQLLTDVPRVASCVAWGDINSDGLADLFVGSGIDQPSALYFATPSGFDNVSELYGMDLLHTNFVRSAQILDANQDGVMDIYFLRADNVGPVLLLQESNHQFSLNQLASGSLLEQPVTSSFWSDLNNDGSLELTLSNSPDTQSDVTVFTRVGDQFTEMRDNPFHNNLTDIGAMTTLDYDFDGDLDVFFGSTTGDAGARLYRSTDGQFIDWSDRFQFPEKMGATGAAWLDYNNDGYWDLFVPGDANTMRLFRGQPRWGIPALEPITMTGLDEALDGVYAHAVDANMDGWMDLFVIKGGTEGCVLMINQEGRGWVNHATRLNLDNTHWTNYAAAWCDFDNNGSPDLALAQGGRGVRLYRNGLMPHHEYFKINLLGRNTLMPLIGCSVEMQFENCKQVATTSPSSYTTGGDMAGLTLVSHARDKSDEVDLIVRWPNGAVQHYGLSDLNRSGTVNLYEPTTILPVADAGSIVLTTNIGISASPNPFNPSTMLSFTLPEATNVDLRVYNLMGQEVATLVQGPLAKGAHRLSFNAGNLPSGLYFARMNAAGTSQLTRLLLAK